MDIVKNVNDFLQSEIKRDNTDQSDQSTLSTTKIISNYVNIMNLLNKKTMFDVLHTFNPASLYKKTYLPLDSRNTYANTNYRLSWYITNTQNIRTGFINTTCKLRDIVCIRLMNCYIYSSFIFIRQTGITDLRKNFSSKRLALYIEEFGQNAATSVSGINFHFLGIPNERALKQHFLDANTYDLAYRLSINEQFNFGKFKFCKPVSLFDKITLSMSDLDYQMPLSGSIILDNCTFSAIVPEGGTVFTIRFTMNDYYYPFIQRAIYNVYLPDITTSDPITDAAWIASVRSVNHILEYLPASLQYLWNYDTGSLPIGTVSFTTVRIDIITTLLAELEITYIDT